MKKCELCNVEFPDGMLKELLIAELYAVSCAVCARKELRKLIPEFEFSFEGNIALLEATEKYLSVQNGVHNAGT